MINEARATVDSSKIKWLETGERGQRKCQSPVMQNHKSKCNYKEEGVGEVRRAARAREQWTRVNAVEGRTLGCRAKTEISAVQPWTSDRPVAPRRSRSGDSPRPLALRSTYPYPHHR